MLKKTITYEGYDGLSYTEDFYFNLTEAEVTTMELGTPGTLSEKITRIIKAQDGHEIMKMFEWLILTSYGVKSDDGKRFIKSEKLSEEFKQTDAYNILFVKLATDAEAAKAFVNGILPNFKHLKSNKNNQVEPGSKPSNINSDNDHS